jgi:hypothetical protein
MLSRFLGRRGNDDKPEFPTREDLPALSGEEAEAALTELQWLVAQDLTDVYTQPFRDVGERYRWNVWLGHELVRGGLRIDLQEWAEHRREWSAE